MPRIPVRLLGATLLVASLGAGCLPGRGEETTPLPPPAAETSSEPASSEPRDVLDAEAFDEASLTAEEDRLLGETDRAGSLHDADVGSLEDAFEQEGESDTRSID